jgi:hypothetical protein
MSLARLSSERALPRFNPGDRMMRTIAALLAGFALISFGARAEDKPADAKADAKAEKKADAKAEKKDKKAAKDEKKAEKTEKPAAAPAK